VALESYTPDHGNGRGDLRCRQWLTDFTTTIDAICRILHDTATTSINGITPNFVDKSRKMKSVQGGLTHRSRVAWKPRRKGDLLEEGRSKYERSLINQISAISVQDDVDLPSWRTLSEMMSKSGGHRIPEGQPVAAVCATIPADDLEKLGISREKALVPGLWEMRSENTDSDDSDEDSVGSKKQEDEHRQDSDVSDEEL
jgi:hypothetical protein